MDIRRYILWLALALIVIALWSAWTKDYPTKRPASRSVQTTAQQSQAANSQFTPSSFAPSVTQQAQHAEQQKQVAAMGAHLSGRLITIKTDVLNATINLNGGNLVSAKLPQYPVSLKQKNVPVQILNPSLDNIYISQNGITNTTVSKQTKPIVFTSAQQSYTLEPGQKVLTVELQGRSGNGLLVTKTFIFMRDKYNIEQSITVKNDSKRVWQGSFYHQLVRRNVPMKHHFHSYSYTGGAISSPQTPYDKLSFKDLNEQNISRNIAGGWVAIQQRYFLSALIPGNDQANHYYSHVSGPASDDGKNRVFTLGFVSPQVTVKPGDQAHNRATLYVGPEIAKNLKPLANGLSRTIDYGWLWIISIAIFWVMQKIYSFIGNWGWSIVLTTLLIKLVFYKLSEKSYRSMAKMRDLQPRLQALRERHTGDKQALSRATMEFYKKEKVNPMGGCLPIIIQIPVFIALYYVLIESVQLRQAPFIFWIHNLSTKDPYYVLPILMGISMFIQQKLSPPPPDPTQAKVMMFLPLVFTVFFATFPSGLVLYWLTNNVISISQQYWILKTYKAKDEKARLRKKRKQQDKQNKNKSPFLKKKK